MTIRDVTLRGLNERGMLHTRAMNALEAAGYETLGEVLDRDPMQLSREVQGFGKRAAKSLLEAAKELKREARAVAYRRAGEALESPQNDPDPEVGREDLEGQDRVQAVQGDGPLTLFRFTRTFPTYEEAERFVPGLLLAGHPVCLQVQNGGYTLSWEAKV